jgi:hypothetical protein
MDVFALDVTLERAGRTAGAAGELGRRERASGQNQDGARFHGNYLLRTTEQDFC